MESCLNHAQTALGAVVAGGTVDASRPDDETLSILGQVPNDSLPKAGDARLRLGGPNAVLDNSVYPSAAIAGSKIGTDSTRKT